MKFAHVSPVYVWWVVLSGSGLGFCRVLGKQVRGIRSINRLFFFFLCW